MKDGPVGTEITERAAEESVPGRARTLPGEILRFARRNKFYWIAPIVFLILLLALLLATRQSAAPFIYTLF